MGVDTLAFVEGKLDCMVVEIQIVAGTQAEVDSRVVADNQAEVDSRVVVEGMATAREIADLDLK